mgnify:CR=1 FL=1
MAPNKYNQDQVKYLYLDMELDISKEVIVGIAVVIYGIILYLLFKPKN